MQKKEIRKNEKVSLKRMLLMGMIAIVIPFVCISILQEYKNINNIYHKLLNSYYNVLETKAEVLETELKQFTGMIINEENSSQPLLLMNYLEESPEYEFQKILFSREIQDKLATYNLSCGIFAVLEDKEDVLVYKNSNISYQVKEKFKEFLYKRIKSKDLDTVNEQGWVVVEDGDNKYLIYLREMDGMYWGGWLPANQFIKQINQEDDENILGYKIEQNNKIFDQIGETGKNKIVQMTYYGDVSNLEYSILLNQTSAIIQLFQTTIYGILFIMVLLLIIVAGISFVNKKILNPMSEIADILNNYTKEEKIMLKSKSNIKEFTIMIDSFNYMIQTIYDLRINFYEERLMKQKTKLAYLTMQTKPHFYVNSLNIIHSLAEIRNYELIQQMTDGLSEYLRYIFRGDQQFATIEDEMMHVDNFMAILCIRYGTNLDYSVKISDDSLAGIIPVLLIQTFIENSLKYAEKSIEKLEIIIEIKKILVQQEDRILIKIYDNGVGFSENILNKLKNNERIIDDQREHIGIYNVLERMKLLYGESGSAYFYNKEHSGAVVEISLPFLVKQELEKKNEFTNC